MTTCWSIGLFLIFFLGSLCVWNCFNRDDEHSNADWHGCSDSQGSPTDFFILYKLPADKHNPMSLIKEGVAYMYLMPDSATRLQSGGVSSVLSYSDSASDWLLSNVSINDESSIVGRTMKRFYHDSDFEDNVAFIMYNDEFPDGSTSLSHGHSKGVIVLSEYGGFWLVHSVPKYPPSPDNVYSYPTSAHRYGQTMLCISLPPVSRGLVKSIGEQLMQNDIDIYGRNLPRSFKKYKILQDIVDGRRRKDPPYYHVSEISSAYGKTFTSFAKYKKFDDDLYSGLVAPLLKTNLLVESWRNGIEPLDSSCNSTYTVQNIKSVEIKVAASNFTTHHDHSKWAVAEDSDRPFVCIGDINRMKTQYSRGGGTVCIWSLSIWYRFKGLIKDVEACPKINLIPLYEGEEEKDVI